MRESNDDVKFQRGLVFHNSEDLKVWNTLGGLDEGIPKEREEDRSRQV